MRKLIYPLLFGFAAAVVGCESTTPNTPARQEQVRDEGRDALDRMTAQDPRLQDVVQSAYAYAIFPKIGEGAVGVGGAAGSGSVYRNGQYIGGIKMTQASVGLQLGGESYSELIVFQDDQALNRVMENKFEFGADAQATFVKSGAAASGSFNHGVRIFVLPSKGLMAGVSLTGQKFHFYPSTTGYNPDYNRDQYNNRDQYGNPR